MGWHTGVHLDASDAGRRSSPRGWIGDVKFFRGLRVLVAVEACDMRKG